MYSKTQDLGADCLHPSVHTILFNKYIHQGSPEQKKKNAPFQDKTF